MSDAIPDEMMEQALRVCIAAVHPYQPGDVPSHIDVPVIARALMAADEAATKRAAQWQPIETAPKDGEGFLAYWPISETQWCIVTCWWKTTGAAGPGWHTVDLFDDDSERLILPTKWQPLPPPPAILKGEA